jgi:hypothetical protein
MQFRLITLFKWMTAIAVILAIAILVVPLVSAEISRIQGPRLLVWGRFFAVWVPIVGGVLLFLWWGLKGKPNKPAITYGLIVGVTLGVIAGNVTSLGEWAIDHFNPGLPYQDFRSPFGSLVGGIAGAWFGALAGGIASRILRRRTLRNGAVSLERSHRPP